MRWLSALTLLLLAGCLETPRLPRAPDGEVITISTDPGWCMGDCRWIDVAISSNGRGRYHYHHDDIIERLGSVRLRPDAFERLDAKLAALRTATVRSLDGPEDCDQFASDLGGYHVSWKGRGPDSRLDVNDGCISREADEVRAVIVGALASLGLKEINPSAGVPASTMMPGKR